MTILFSDQRHVYINRQSYREAVDVGNKVISQNNIQRIANIIFLQRVLLIKLVNIELVSAKPQPTILCKSKPNANDNRRKKRFVLISHDL